MRTDLKQKIKITTMDYIAVLIGTGLYALSVHMFTLPNNIAPGGVTGLATVIHALTGFPIGTISFLFNIPLLILGFLFLGRHFILKTFVSILSFTVYTDLLFVLIPTYDTDRLLASIFGGVLMGAGLGLVYLRGGSTGGTDIVNRLLQRKFPFMKLGRLVFITDVIVIAIATIVFRNIETALYGIVVIFIQTQVMDQILYGLDTGKAILVITNQQQKLSQAIMERMQRGCTILPATGAYSGEERAVVLCAVRRNEFYKLQRLIHAIDPSAFLIVTDAGEALGQGFKPADKEV